MEYAELRLYDKYGGNKKENKEDEKINSNNKNEETIKKYRKKVIEQREEIKKYQREIAILKSNLEARN